ncbi:nitrilase-related carbon-nitrogen hydrolase [Coraliomargarita sp. SDUM461004]|uniref:Nitrilase-related carbon-nitrogen hydrolase n=1 Tax=Thalassobacterium sedimentorum TaxID=3041258 RepID=A0ABU1AG61_9BACT|nr:nitrilase-related carbon-nitrogen hydrolase [Coraliomargarita sp. SDUM461004]MDQ8193768.1 nitrilase-related carbon-nitrogen hydrolase [Coraliomargarita sp. SDUM461004]
MKLALAQFEVARANPAENLVRIGERATTASAAGVDLLCLPEMCTTGFDWSYNREHLAAASKIIDAVATIARSHSLAICGSFLEQTESGNAANCFCYFDANGVLLASYRKLHLFTLFREEQHVEAGNECITVATDFGTIAAAICYDLRFPELFRRNTASGAFMHILPAAFPHPRLDHWRTLVRARAIENQTYFVAVNQCGLEGHHGSVDKTQYFGHSMVVDPWGEIVLEADENESLLDIEIDPRSVDQVRSKLSAWDDRREDLFRI